MRPGEVTGKVGRAESNQRRGLATAGPVSVPCRHQKDRAEARTERATGLQGTVLHGPAGVRAEMAHMKNSPRRELGARARARGLGHTAPH